MAMTVVAPDIVSPTKCVGMHNMAMGAATKCVGIQNMATRLPNFVSPPYSVSPLPFLYPLAFYKN